MGKKEDDRVYRKCSCKKNGGCKPGNEDPKLKCKGMTQDARHPRYCSHCRKKGCHHQNAVDTSGNNLYPQNSHAGGHSPYASSGDALPVPSPIATTGVSVTSVKTNAGAGNDKFCNCYLHGCSTCCSENCDMYAVSGKRQCKLCDERDCPQYEAPNSKAELASAAERSDRAKETSKDPSKKNATCKCYCRRTKSKRCAGWNKQKKRNEACEEGLWRGDQCKFCYGARCPTEKTTTAVSFEESKRLAKCRCVNRLFHRCKAGTAGCQREGSKATKGLCTGCSDLGCPTDREYNATGRDVLLHQLNYNGVNCFCVERNHSECQVGADYCTKIKYVQEDHTEVRCVPCTDGGCPDRYHMHGGNTEGYEPDPNSPYSEARMQAMRGDDRVVKDKRDKGKGRAE
ncbi:hypothetical protein QBC44DRAFT_306337 [Cladorrhinum sp. PSN332]|nr:hypothetical protein QBC44DRAFT_306337 [Cladorrhinum sp. PSN332]